jgi:hypothetical protein
MSPGNPNRKRIFTPSDDALIREQPVTGIGLKALETMLRTTRETLMRRADELGVSLVISDQHDVALDTRPLRCTNGLVDPLLERLKQVHGDTIARVTHRTEAPTNKSLAGIHKTNRECQ